MNINNYQLGKMGEKIAEEYLLNNKYEIIEKNFYCKQGEIDIIAKKEQYIIFVEVKTRNSLKYGRPAEAVNNKKMQHLIKSSQYYLYKNNIKDKFIRFDVIEILIEDKRININHIKQII